MKNSATFWNKRTRRGLAIIIVIILACLLFAVSANAQQKATCTLDQRYLSAWQDSDGFYHATDSVINADASSFVTDYSYIYIFKGKVAVTIMLTSYKDGKAQSTSFVRIKPQASFPFKDEEELLEMIAKQ